MSLFVCLVIKSCLILLQRHGLSPTRLLCPWDFPGKNTGVGYHFLLQGICGAVSKESACQCRDTRDLGSIPGLERSLGGGNGNPLQYSCLENSMDRGAWGGYGPWGHKESDTTEHTQGSNSHTCIDRWILYH